MLLLMHLLFYLFGNLGILGTARRRSICGLSLPPSSSGCAPLLRHVEIGHALVEDLGLLP